MPLSAKPLSPHNFLEPLRIILAEHDRQHRVAAWLQTQSDGRQLAPIKAQAETLLSFLTRDLLVHHQDEEHDLFPLLEARCEPDDGIDAILAELDQDHAAESFLIRDIAVDLRALMAGQDPETPGRFFNSLSLFAEGQQRHLSWENRVVMPLAGQRLKRHDLDVLGRNMAARRGIAFPG
jgi:hemerythrin-like domain-containing protein